MNSIIFQHHHTPTCYVSVGAAAAGFSPECNCGFTKKSRSEFENFNLSSKEGGMRVIPRRIIRKSTPTLTKCVMMVDDDDA